MHTAAPHLTRGRIAELLMLARTNGSAVHCFGAAFDPHLTVSWSNAYNRGDLTFVYADRTFDAVELSGRDCEAQIARAVERYAHKIAPLAVRERAA